MKTDIHPKLHPVVFVDSARGVEFVTVSTLTSKDTKKINGVDHFMIRVDISSASHPFYTGEKTLVDTAGRVDKFKAKIEAAKKLQEQLGVKKERKKALKKETLEEAITRKAKANTERKEAEKAEAKAVAKKASVKKKANKEEVAKKEVAKSDKEEE